MAARQGSTGKFPALRERIPDKGVYGYLSLSPDISVANEKSLSARVAKDTSEGTAAPSPNQSEMDYWRHHNIGRTLNNAMNRFENRVLQILAENGHDEVRFSQVNLTRNLDLDGTITSELARRAGMTKQAMGEIVEQCEQLGLVERTRDKRDARAKIVRFTALGLEWLEAFRIALTQAEQEMRDELGYLRTDAIASALGAYGRDFDQLGRRSEQNEEED
jgi:DNA-binding MarR family transcriptional regulator